ncbi:sodium-independent sulfate anion transporter [Drosophila guanche]|uniref:Blast:Sodium-independent sulfate anion transporter n=1 Tax=Drosophila guanche TaxID=7266 RepID=A0A3B0JIL0_DROGU|nr:sodium-independent sulfate anion transporter [Drosophila guanche]XP_034127985.1 sodium-independent sulfate anion transporter [Drosophila guanche]XP_034127986.1 sodium-independent sulfate anion transporter [Drosophila guanche]SPP80152.1 blast:Sodium-independent sulfate anion transporter [Drosophila guanche]
MKSNPASDHVYFNDGFKCSTISIHTNLNEQNGSSNNSVGSSTGSKEFILTEDGKKVKPTRSTVECTRGWLQDCSRRTFNRKTLHKRLPILGWLPRYSSQDAVGDLVAGITVGLTVIPQALAYAGIAGLPVAYGLYASFLGCFVYIFLGSCKDVPMGPSAIVALLTFQAAQGSWQKSVLLCLLSGIVELLMGLFGLGFLIDFVSGPVSSGFTSAVSLIILTSQIQSVLGITAKGNTFVEIWTQVFHNIEHTRPGDTVLGLTCIVVLLLMRSLSSRRIGPEDESLRSRFQRVVNKVLWIVGTARNAILVVVCCLMGYLLHTEEHGAPFRVVGDIPPGLPSVQLPPTSLSANETSSGAAESFVEMVHSMGSGLIVIPLISLMENIAICKAFANGKSVDASQELIAIGTANIFNSFVQGFPGTGALSRGAVNNASGVRTPLSNIYSGGLVMIALLFLTPYFYFIPRPTLAAIIIAAVVFMIEVKVVKPMWRAKKSDLVPGVGTFVACLVLPLEWGILIGVGLNVIFILYHAARPKLSTELLTTQSGTDYMMITPDRCLIFPSVDYVRNLVNKQSMRQNVPVVIDASHVYGADFTTATVIDSLISDFNQRGQLLFFYNLKPSICAIFEQVSAAQFVVYYQEQQLDELLKERNYTQKRSETA